MRILNAISLGACLLLTGASTASAEVQLSLENGRVTLVAKDATVRQILTEWARVGQTKIVNVERIPGGPLTLQFTRVPEDEVLDVLLRSVSGYMAAPRPVQVTNLSRFDRIMVMPVVLAPRTQSLAAAPAIQQPGFPPPPPLEVDDQNQQGPNSGQPARGAIFQTFPQPQVVGPPAVNNPQQVGAQPPATDQAPAANPGASSIVGAPRPGMVITPPPPPAVAPPAGFPAPRRDN